MTYEHSSELDDLKSCLQSDPVVGQLQDGPPSNAPLAHGAVTGLLSKVTAPLRASALPVRLAPVSRVIDCSAIMVPIKMELVPNVAELPTCQKMFLAWAPPARTT